MKTRKIEVDLEYQFNVVLNLEKGICFAYDAQYDVQSDPESIVELFKEELSDLKKFDPVEGEMETAWAEELIGVLGQYLEQARQHNNALPAAA
ncbi:MAG: hypothetical protein L6Q57_03230 [Alphaproteobacteria bacterium]|nr:hypothetical protein [Alphaproteobacteria bacterium]